MTKSPCPYHLLFLAVLGVVLLAGLLLPSTLHSQGLTDDFLPSIQFGKEGRLGFFAHGSLWARYTDCNPYSTVQDDPVDQQVDISIRRVRIGAYGTISKRMFLKFMVGTNNLNYINNENKLSILDAYGKYTFTKWLNVGLGKNNAVGLSRYSALSSSSLLTLDVPIFVLPMVNISDDITRRFGVFVEGQAGNFDYTLVLAKPFVYTKNVALSQQASFSTGNPSWQPSAYVAYNFFDQESQTSTVATGTYFGTKKIMNLGAGFLYQPRAMESVNGVDTLKHDILLWSVDFLIDMPLNADNSKSITFYAAYFNYDFGPGFIRKIGISNPANGTSTPTYAEAGNSYPAIGTGDIYYVQAGYRLATTQVEGMEGIQPYASVQYSLYDYLDEAMVLYEYGINFLFRGHDSKLTLGIQHRPVFEYNTASDLVKSSDKMMAILQYQFRLRSN